MKNGLTLLTAGLTLFTGTLTSGHAAKVSFKDIHVHEGSFITQALAAKAIDTEIPETATPDPKALEEVRHALGLNPGEPIILVGSPESVRQHILSIETDARDHVASAVFNKQDTLVQFIAAAVNEKRQSTPEWREDFDALLDRIEELKKSTEGEVQETLTEQSNRLENMVSSAVMEARKSLVWRSNRRRKGNRTGAHGSGAFVKRRRNPYS
jgi:hypothetical protein